MNKSTIEWTDRTWNPVSGCTKVSQGCKFCYAERNAHRWGKDFSTVVCHEKKLSEPMSIREPQRIFVNSMSDLFHEDVPFTFIHMVFITMRLANRHTYQILTKRPARMLEYFEWAKSEDLKVKLVFPLSNVWLGVSCENQETADERIPLLMKVPAAVRFLSCEPLLGPINITSIRSSSCSNYKPLEHHPCGSPDKPFINWVIAGGESGPGARPMHPDWARSLRDQCEASNVPFFFKQWGEWRPNNGELDFTVPLKNLLYLGSDGKTEPANTMNFKNGKVLMKKAGKKYSGNILDDKQHLNFPNPLNK